MSDHKKLVMGYDEDLHAKRSFLNVKSDTVSIVCKVREEFNILKKN